MKTVLQELLEWIDSAEGRAMEDAWWEIQVKIQELLPKEKEMIDNAFNDAVDDTSYKLGIDDKYIGYKDSEDYYKQKYENIVK